MKLKVLNFLLAASAILLLDSTGVLKGVGASLEYVNCPGRNSTANVNVPFIPCDYDCRTNHAALTGNCTDDGLYNCICQESGQHPYTGDCTYQFLDGVTFGQPYGCQCYTNSSAITPGIGAMYEGTCDFDCRCDHGAARGSCDFEIKACICDYTFPAGGTWNDSYCPFGLAGNATRALINAVNAGLG